MTEEMRMKYIDFLDSKGCIREGLHDVHCVEDGKFVTKKVMAKIIESTPELYMEFCKLNGLEVKDVFIFGDKINMASLLSGLWETN